MTFGVISILSRTPNLIKELQLIIPNAIFHEVNHKTAGEDAQLKASKIVISDYDLLGPHLYNLPNLKWVQGTWAGVESLMPFIQTDNLPKVPITRFSGVHFGQLMGEYVIANIINFERDLFRVREKQFSGEWYRKGKITKYRALSELSIGIMGLGNIGNKIGQTLHYMGAEVHGYGRRDKLSDYEDTAYISSYFPQNNLKSFLESCDYFVNILPKTKDTVGLLDGDVLLSCKERGAIFINIGRGAIIKEASLINALEKEWLSGAILDVFEKEPLSPDNALWKFPQVFITPHVSGMSRAKDIAAQFNSNLNLFNANAPIPNQIDFNKGY